MINIKKNDIYKKKLINNNCVICLENFKKSTYVTQLPCKHFFHSKCIFSLIKSKKGNYWYKCPNCRCELLEYVKKIKNCKVLATRIMLRKRLLENMRLLEEEKYFENEIMYPYEEKKKI